MDFDNLYESGPYLPIESQNGFGVSSSSEPTGASDQASQVQIITEPVNQWSPISIAPTALPTPSCSSSLAPKYTWNQEDEVAQLRGELAMEREKSVRAEAEIQKLQASERLSADMVIMHHLRSRELERENQALQSKNKDLEKSLKTTVQSSSSSHGAFSHGAAAITRIKKEILEDEEHSMTLDEVREIWRKKFSGGILPGKNLKLGCYFFDPSTNEAPQKVNDASNSYIFYRNQRPASKGYSKWNELTLMEKEEWTNLWRILRKEQERQWKAGLIKFEKVVLFRMKKEKSFE
ncbi:Protein CBG07836 [Caenorhabditis briggsae]|uniref:Protein CBG07836 n=1 Tax=Caenorhabditis briggsae TaxID=6238 RepID=A8X588_CAEBR|nr:Protein CBG07836 [Caenorhabditis briggsae]CAP27787.2 Protein CBG07836 [Caenorhabditis briggsae]